MDHLGRFPDDIKLPVRARLAYVRCLPQMPKGELKSEVEAYARSQGFRMKGLFTMDGSKRSSKANAFFTGFGRYRRIVLFDTLVGNHTVQELVSVLAHEMGHYKKRHVFKLLGISVATTGLMLFVLSRFIDNAGLFRPFRMEQTSIYAGIVFFGFLYAPMEMVLSVFGNMLSRRYEYEADEFAAATYGKPQAMIDAHKKLTVDMAPTATRRSPLTPSCPGRTAPTCSSN